MAQIDRAVETVGAALPCVLVGAVAVVLEEEEGEDVG